ncbi:MAG: transglutaminase N-terminal domain-containing protein, partial [Chthoniobacterales bacterium]
MRATRQKGKAGMRVQIENCMRYTYARPVGFSPHVIRLYPRTDQSVVTHKLRTTINIPSDIQYRRDLFDNLTANCFFPQPAETLEVRVQLEVELWPRNPFHFLLAPNAIEMPFQY